MVLTLKPEKYGELLSRAMPKRIETDEELGACPRNVDSRI